MKELLQYIEIQLSSHLNRTTKILNCEQVYGGDINQTFRLETNIDSFFLKLNDASLSDMFKKEFEGLQLLYQTKTIKVPQPILYGSYSEPISSAKDGISLNKNYTFLITELIKKAHPSKNFWKTFAQQLAALHQCSNEQFGLSTSNYIGSLPQRNNFCTTWSEFYAAERILPLAKLAFNQNKFSNADLQLAEKLCKRLYNFFPKEKPSLIHGDLWSGNFMCNENGIPVIFDPSIYYGNREMDIAMSLLFGGFDKSLYEYYNEVLPMMRGWKERIKLCQLYPLLVHVILFGGHYYYNAIAIIKAYS